MTIITILDNLDKKHTRENAICENRQLQIKSPAPMSVRYCGNDKRSQLVGLAKRNITFQSTFEVQRHRGK